MEFVSAHVCAVLILTEAHSYHCCYYYYSYQPVTCNKHLQMNNKLHSVFKLCTLSCWEAPFLLAKGLYIIYLLFASVGLFIDILIVNSLFTNQEWLCYRLNTGNYLLARLNISGKISGKNINLSKKKNETCLSSFCWSDPQLYRFLTRR